VKPEKNLDSEVRAGSRRLYGSEFQVDGRATAKHRRP